MTLCGWCRKVPVSGRQRFCCQRCRQSAFRLRRRSGPRAAEVGSDSKPLRFAYADPPYPGLSAKYYRREANFGGEVDHPALIRSLTADWQSGRIAGWALSTSEKALRELLPLCPDGARVCAWCKPKQVPPATYGLHSSWEALVVVGGRKVRPGIQDYLVAQPARFEGTLPGRKPIAFCAFLFDCLGMLPGDELVDLFPGTGIVGRAWAELSTYGASSVDGRQPLLPLVAARGNDEVDYFPRAEPELVHP